MQPISRAEFLHNMGYGALMMEIKDNLAVVPLVNPRRLPPTVNSTSRFSSVDAQARAVLTWYNLPGIAIGLIRDNKLIYARGYGVQSVLSRKPMTEYTLFAIASLTKMFTGAAIMQLIEAGHLSLEDRYVTHVPCFRMADPRYKDITIRHLLSHTAGFPEVTWASDMSTLSKPWQDDNSARRYVESLKEANLDFEPGSQFRYCNTGYNLLAALILEITGELFEDYQRRHILDPLQMFSSSFLKTEVKAENLAAAHVRDTNGNPIVSEIYPYTRQSTPSGGLITNIVDLSHWVMANINGGVYYNRIMKAETQEQLWVPVYDNPLGWTGTGYCPGFFFMRYAESGLGPVRMVISFGGTIGVVTHMTMFPDQGIAAIVLVNLRASPKDPDYAWGVCDKLAIQMLNGEL